MKILYMHAKGLKIKTDTASKSARELAKKLSWPLPKVDKQDERIESRNALLALICVEKGDEKLELGEVRDDLIRAKRLLGVPEIVMGPFAHLSSNVADPFLAIEVLERLEKMTRGADFSIRQFPFGWDKSLELRLPCHHYNAAIRTFAPLENAWDGISGEYSEYMEKSGHYAAQGRALGALVRTGAVSGNILEICCGGGFTLDFLCRHDKMRFIAGLDSSGQMLEISKRRIHGRRSGMINFVKGRAEEIDELFGADSFDTLMMVNACAYMDIRLVLEKAPRVIREGANIVIMEEDPFVPAFFSELGEREKLELARAGHTPIGEIIEIAKGMGFTLVDTAKEEIDEAHSLIGVVFQKN